MGTRARLGYAAFDAQLWKAYFVTTLYAIRTSVCASPVQEITYLVMVSGTNASPVSVSHHESPSHFDMVGDHVSLRPVLVI